MSYRDLYCTKYSGFLNLNIPYSEAEFVLFGVPLDASASFVGGARFGPESIRRASLNLETFDFEDRIDVKKLRLIDIGDVDIDNSSLEENLNRVEKVVSEIISDSKKPLVLGGEHTLTLGTTRCLRKFALLCFDAHLDLRDEYVGSKLSHASVMRRVLGETRVEKIVFVGTRAVSTEEYKFVKDNPKITIISAGEALDVGFTGVADRINDEFKDCGDIYVSIDIDVLDPSAAPNVGNPEPGGFSYEFTRKLISKFSGNIVGADITEVAPVLNIDITSIFAAKLAFDLLKKMK